MPFLDYEIPAPKSFETQTLPLGWWLLGRAIDADRQFDVIVRPTASREPLDGTNYSETEPPV